MGDVAWGSMWQYLEVAWRKPRPRARSNQSASGIRTRLFLGIEWETFDGGAVVGRGPVACFRRGQRSYGSANEGVADLRGISVSTVKNYWNFSRAWLIKEIGPNFAIRS